MLGPSPWQAWGPLADEHDESLPFQHWWGFPRRVSSCPAGVRAGWPELQGVASSAPPSFTPSGETTADLCRGLSALEPGLLVSVSSQGRRHCSRAGTWATWPGQAGGRFRTLKEVTLVRTQTAMVEVCSPLRPLFMGTWGDMSPAASTGSFQPRD